MTRPRDDDLEERIDELEAALRDVNEELKQRSPRGPFGLPRPPSPGEILRFTDEAAIPAAIAILEANIRLLEALRHAIRLMESGDRARRGGGEVGSGAAHLGTRALSRFDAALADLERVVDGTPADVPGHDVLADAQDLRDDLAARIERAERLVDEAGYTGEPPVGSDTNGGTTIDVDAELESIRREQENEDDGDEEDDESG